MDGSRVSFFGLAALPAVGEMLLDPRPALVFSADGARVLFANAAAVMALDATNLDDLLARRFTDLNPIKAQMARLSRILPTEQPRLEVLRFGGGVSSTTLTAACRRLNLADGERAVLAVGAGGLAPESLRARADRLTDALAGRRAQAAIVDDAGKIVATSAPDGELLDADDIREFADAARAARDRPISERQRRRGETIHAHAVCFAGDGRDLALVLVQRDEDRAELVPMTATAQSIAAPSSAVAAPPSTEAAPTAPASPSPAVVEVSETPASAAEPVRFTFELDREGRFVSVTAELAARVGRANGALAGHVWAELADRFGSAGDAITRALATGGGFSARLPWPAGHGDAVAVELTAITDPRTHGYRGFGLIGDAMTAASGVASLELDTPTMPATAPAPQAVPAPPAIAEPASSLSPPPRAIASETAPDLDDVAQRSIERGSGDLTTGETPIADVAATSPAPADGAMPAARATATEPSNVVRLPGAPAIRVPEPLSGIERDAFRRIAEALGTRNAATTPAEPAAAASAPSEPARPAAGGDGIDARLIDRLPLGLVIFREGRTLFVNRTLLDLLGYSSADAFLQKGGADAIFPEGDEIAGRVSAADGNVVVSRADGGTMQVKAWLHAVPFDGATALMLAIAALDRDTSLVSALAESEARADELEAILDTATDGVIVVDRRGRMQSMNRAAEALFGIDASQYFDRYFTDLLADESQKAALDYLDGLIANGVASVLNDGREVIGRTPSGGLIPLFMTMGRIGTSDKFCAVLRDITHWKNVEEELVAARRAAETANTQKSDFLAKISHEIRTPLNAIIGFSEVMASERFGPIGNERYREYLRDIHVSGGHLMSLINDLLDLSKIEAGKADLAFEAVPINAAIQECVALMQPQANRERIIIRTALAADVPNVVADPRSLRQILLNLLSNAVKFTRAGGQVIVSTSLEGSGEVVVRIRDTGIGMSEKDIETALKPFRQVATAREDRDQGTGLGLPLTKALVEANRATFSIDSAPNQGTLVKITFPTTRVLAG
jgi:PAS domain S-box-containing protein